jgi:WD40 repeat protein
VGGTAISADGNIILSADLLSFRKINSQTGEVDITMNALCNMFPMAVSPDGMFALLHCGNSVFRWEVAHWREQSEIIAAWEDARTITISQDGRLGIVGYSDGSLRLWNLVDALDYQTFQTGMTFPDALAVSPDGQTILLGNSDTITKGPSLWNIAAARIVETLPGFIGINSPNTIAFNSDGRYAAAGGGDFAGGASLVV